MPCSNPKLLYKYHTYVDKETGEIKNKYAFESFAANSPKVFLSSNDGLTYIIKDEYKDDCVLAPCRSHCMSCRLESSRIWAARCVFEAQMHEQNCFLTLTYDDEHLPSDYGLHLRDMQLFWKRLRKNTGLQFKVFYCGEYGEKFGRPHYHALVFGYKPSDLVLFSVRGGNNLYLSPFVARTWSHGFVSVGDATFDSAAYVAGYIMKKWIGDPEYYQGRKPPFIAMSKRHGIGYEWYQKYKKDVYPNDFVVVRNGIKMKPPRYFETLYDRDFDYQKDVLPEVLKIKRLEKMRGKMIRSPTDYTFKRLGIKEQYLLALQRKKVRDYEVSN